MCAFVRVPRLHPTLPGGPPVARGCAGVAVGRICPPPSPLVFFGGGGGASRCSWVSWSPSPRLLSFGLRLRVFFFSFRVVCVRVFWVALLPVGRGSRCGVAGFGWEVLRCSLGCGVWPLLVVWVGGFVAVGLSRAPPPCFFFGGGGSACSSLCLPWAAARTGRLSVWSSGLLLVLAFFQALPWPHGSGVLCTRLARCPFLPG